jgi:hypothetical protein
MTAPSGWSGVAGGDPTQIVPGRDWGDVGRLGALLALALLELDASTFGEALEAFAGDVAVVHEEILRSFVGGDKAVPLAVVEPLNGSGCHGNTSLQTHEQVRKAHVRRPDSL